MTDNINIEELRAELNRLRVATENIERLIAQPSNEDREEEPRQERPPAEENRRGNNYRYNHPVVHDVDNVEIIIGDRVRFVTRGLFNTSSGVVYKITPSGTRVTSRDTLGRSISRAPHNLRVTR